MKKIIIVLSLGYIILMSSCATYKTNKCNAYGNTYNKPSKQSAMKCPGW